MLPRFLENTLSYLSERIHNGSAVRLWNNGSPVEHSFEARRKWPISKWTDLLRQNKIVIRSIYSSNDIASVLTLIQEPSFWEVVAVHLPTYPPMWDALAVSAFESGNIACLEILPREIQKKHIKCAQQHPVSKKWVMEHPVFGTDIVRYAQWAPLSYKSHTQNYLKKTITAQDVLNIVRANIEFSGRDTAIHAFRSLATLIHTYNKFHSTHPVTIHHEPTTKQLVRDIWNLTGISVPVEIICSAYYLEPDPATTSPELYQDCLAILHCAGDYDKEIKTLVPRNTNISLLDVELSFMQPKDQEELIGTLLQHYRNLNQPMNSLNIDHNIF